MKKTNIRLFHVIGLLALGWLAQAPSAGADSTAKKPAPLKSQVLAWESMPVKQTALGNVRPIFNTPTATLAKLESHVTTLNPGLDSHAVHRHAHEELIIIKEGTVEVTLNDEKKTVGPGAILFYASNDPHKIKNVGTTPAVYHVFTFYTAETAKLAVKK
ncbi:MAG: cupin domain-containing protein [Verrucomicrobiota bacterium]